MYYWYFTPDDADIAACKGAYFPVLGNDAKHKTESQAMWHGERWMKSAGRTGTIAAVPVRKSTASYILDI